MSNDSDFEGKWALILGASSGFGAAAARHLASLGLDIFGVHLDRRATMGAVDELKSEITGMGRKAFFVNINAADDELRKKALADFMGEVGGGRAAGSIRVLMHSLAFGALKPYFSNGDTATITRQNIEMTLDVMAHSLVYWVQDAMQNDLLAKGSSIYAMTSSGGARVLPSYGAVSAAKAALESHVRQFAYELGPLGIRANSIRAGVTDTPALRKIPGNDILLHRATQQNPRGRLTTPEDVAHAIGALAGPGGEFISGNVVGVDGGEDIVG